MIEIGLADDMKMNGLHNENLEEVWVWFKGGLTATAEAGLNHPTQIEGRRLQFNRADKFNRWRR